MRPVIRSAAISLALLSLGAFGCTHTTALAPNTGVKVGTTQGSNSNATLQRPISDFITAQYAASSQVAWLGHVPNDDNNINFGYVDYAGVLGAAVAAAGGQVPTPEFSGTVTDRPQADGTSIVTVNLHFSNVACWGRNEALPGTPVVFGYSSGQLVANHSLAPATASGTLIIKFTNPAPGAPLPSFYDLSLNPAFAGRLLEQSFRSSGFGTMRAASGSPEGTPGKMTVAEVGLFVPGNGSPSGNGPADGYPADILKVQPLGN